MFMSFYDPTISARDDIALSRYVDDVEATVGREGVGEQVKQKFNWITGRTSLWWLVQQEGIQKRLPNRRVIFDERFSIDALTRQVTMGPVIIGTKKMGGLSGGHIILLVDHDSSSGSFIVNDPYGNARIDYESAVGFNLRYPAHWLERYIDYGKRTCRVIYAL
jgi:hypothetical protein